MILLVDDDTEFQSEARQIPALQPMVAAGRAEQANRLVEHLGGELALALVDLDLPEINGFQLIEELKKSQPALPVIAISGVFSNDVLASAKLLGANEVLKKPITPEWFQTVERFVGVTHKPATGHFRCRCGARLMFGSGSASLQQVSDVQRIGSVKRGRCPNCGLLHRVRV